MRNIFPSFFAFSVFIFCSTVWLQAEESSTPSPAETKAPSEVVTTRFEPFTGKIAKNKVRLRLQPTYDGQVLKELKRNDLVVVLGETEDFYAVQPPSDMKAYVFRTFVLDHLIEGKNVNVRLKPDIEAPIVVQLNSGDPVEGAIYPANNKWLEIKMPETARFYVAKEYIEKVGDVGFLTRLQKKQEAAYQLLVSTEETSKKEMQKPFEQIHLEGIKASYQYIIQNYPEFPEAGVKAKELLAALQEAYTSKKVAYLESKAQVSFSTLEKNRKLAEELQSQRMKIAQLEQQIEQTRQVPIVNTVAMNPTVPAKKSAQLPVNMAAWVPIEESLFAQWAQQTGHTNPQEFYDQQKQEAFILKGVLDLYTRPENLQLKNKPGDYMLINPASKLPIAYLYSTQINLQEHLGHEVSLLVAPRPNNHYAFPAYFVLTLE